MRGSFKENVPLPPPPPEKKRKNPGTWNIPEHEKIKLIFMEKNY